MTARVVLPTPTVDIDTDEEIGEDGEEEEVDDADFLSDFPDDTEVRSIYLKICAQRIAFYRVFIPFLGTRVVAFSYRVFGGPKTGSIRPTSEETMFKAELCFLSGSRNVSSVEQTGRIGFV